MSFKYFIKKLGHQELGSVDASGRPQRGRYVFISKHMDVLSLLPPLSEKVVNDSSLLPILPLYNGIKTYANFVYHNDKISTSNGTRDEYRLYLNKYLDSRDKLFYKSGDYIIIRKAEQLVNGKTEVFYALDYVKSDDIGFAKFMSEQKPLRANSGQFLFNGVIDFFEKRLDYSLNNTSIALIDDKVIDTIEAEQREGKSVEDLFGAQSFRDFVLTGYGYKCAVTNKVIFYKTFYNLEAAHIWPKSHKGNYMPNNGLALSRDVHWAFDKGFFTITEDYLIQVHPDVTSDLLSQYNGKKIRLPDNPFFLHSKDSILYHNRNVYGLFKTTGRL